MEKVHKKNADTVKQERVGNTLRKIRARAVVDGASKEIVGHTAAKTQK
jgi:hypothetical protein